MKLRVKAPVLVACAAGVVFALTGYECYRSQFDYIGTMRTHELEGVGMALKSGIDALCRSAAMQADFFANLGSVRDGLRAHDSDAVAAAVKPAYTHLATKYSTVEGRVIDHDLKVFCDFAGERVGDDVSGNEMIVGANRYHETQSGVEGTAHGLAVRAVASVDSGSEHLGCLEWGVGFGKLLDYLKNKNHMELSVFVDERSIHNGNGKNGEGEGAGGLRTVASTAEDLVKDVLPKDFLATVTEPIYTSRERLGVEYDVVALPLFDFAGRQIGVMGGVRPVAESRKEIVTIARVFQIGTALGVVLVAVVVFVVFHVLMKRPLEALEESVQRFAKEGDIHTPVVHLGRPDEFGVASKNLNKLREKLVADAKLAEEAQNIVTTRRLKKDSERLGKPEGEAPPA
jgi:HAMP domain-containing protein